MMSRFRSHRPLYTLNDWNLTLAKRAGFIAPEEPAMEVETRKKKEGDGDVESTPEGEPSRRRVSGKGWDLSSGIRG